MDQALTLYKVFNTVAVTCNISHAANELYTSQPAISKAIRKLEDNLGTKLFYRTSRGVSLTEEGKILFEYTKSAFDTLTLGESTIKKNLNLGVGHLKIGVSSTLCKYILLPYLKSYVEKFPHIKITIECQSTFHTLRLLEEHKLDIGLIGRPETMKNLWFQKVTEIEDVFVSTASYLKHLSLRESIPISFPSKQENRNIISDNTQRIVPFPIRDIFPVANLMLLDETNITRLYIDDYFRRNVIQTNQILEVSNMDLLIEFTKIGLGISCVVKEFIQQELINGSLIELPLENPLGRREIGFAFEPNHKISDIAKSFLDFIEHA